MRGRRQMSGDGAPAAIEERIRAQLGDGDTDGALETTLRVYGPEVFGFLVGMLGEEATAADAFSLFGENLWRGLPKFDWRCSLRGWAYVIARNAARRSRSRDKHARREVILDMSSPAQCIVAATRTVTDAWRRTEAKERLKDLRAALSPEDQEILVLRVDRGLDWNEVARVTLGDEGLMASDEELRREAARVRKRFQLLREQLHELARRTGLVPEGEGG